MHNLCSTVFSRYKALAHFGRLEMLSLGKDIFPVTAEVDIANYCNHNCIWCIDPLHKDNLMQKDFCQSLLKELRHLGVKGIVFKGAGEPMLHPLFSEILSIAAKLGFEAGIVTNGSMLNGKNAKACAENASYVRISIDGPTAKSHKRVHGSNDFARIIENSRNLVKLRGKRQLPVIGLSFAMDHKMKSLIPKAIKLGEKTGVDYILIRPPFFGEVGRKPTMTRQQSAALRKAMRQAAAAYKGKMEIFVDDWVSDSEAKQESSAVSSAGRRSISRSAGVNGFEHISKECLASPLMAVILADGEVYGCCNLTFLEEWSFGKIDYAKGISFKKVWHSAKRKRVLAKMRKTKCIRHCTHPMSRYNEIISYLKDGKKLHSGFL